MLFRDKFCRTKGIVAQDITQIMCVAGLGGSAQLLIPLSYTDSLTLHLLTAVAGDCEGLSSSDQSGDTWNSKWRSHGMELYPNPNTTWFCYFISKDMLSNPEITKVCIVIDKPKFRGIYDLVSSGFKSLFCMCSSVSDHKQWSIVMATISDLLKDIKGRKFFKVFLVSLLIKYFFSVSRLTVFTQTVES